MIRNLESDEFLIKLCLYIVRVVTCKFKLFVTSCIGFGKEVAEVGVLLATKFASS